jgi:hypothetical protein
MNKQITNIIKKKKIITIRWICLDQTPVTPLGMTQN